MSSADIGNIYHKVSLV